MRIGVGSLWGYSRLCICVRGYTLKEGLESNKGSSLTYARVYAQVYGRFKRYFRVAKYDQVADERFEEVKAWLQGELRRVRGGTLQEQESLF